MDRAKHEGTRVLENIVKKVIADCIGALGQRGVTGNCNGQAGPLVLVLVFH